ncbi:MAG: DUF4276 family protein [Deltaproteobacteria bacterium]|nr:DUF4276 family protein [Deltaproteobacteria bacterium]
MAVHIPPPIRTPKTKLLRPGELERAVELAARRVGSRGAVFVVLDSDDDCPAQRGPELLKRAILTRSDLPLTVVLAKREFEAWFLAAAKSLRGQRGLSKDLEPPPDPEAVYNTKGWLSHRMESGRAYRETLDQPALAACFDLDMARRAGSFDKCYRDIVRLLWELRKMGAPTATNPDTCGLL